MIIPLLYLCVDYVHIILGSWIIWKQSVVNSGLSWRLRKSSGISHNTISTILHRKSNTFWLCNTTRLYFPFPMHLADPKTKKNKCSIDEASHSHGKNDLRYVTYTSTSNLSYTILQFLLNNAFQMNISIIFMFVNV